MFFYFNYIRRFLYIYEENRKHEQSRKKQSCIYCRTRKYEGLFVIIRRYLYTHL